MSTIQRIDVNIRTGDFENAGTDDRVYLGIGGREFRLDSSKNDFERGAGDVFVIGSNSNLKNKTRNDCRDPAIDSDDLDLFPVYIRSEGEDWNITFANVEVAGTGFGIIQRDKGLWLGEGYGYIRYLRQGRFGE